MNRKTRRLAILGPLTIAVILVAAPFLLGQFKLLVVLSGSMEPILGVGDVAIMEDVPSGEVESGDIISFEDPLGREKVLVTHRVIDVTRGDQVTFQTKGDAVEEADPFQVTGDQLVGRTIFLIPWAGHLINAFHEKNPFVFIGLIVIPSGLLVINEVRAITSRKSRRRDLRLKRRKSRARLDPRWGRLVAIILLSTLPFLALSAPFFAQSGSVAESGAGKGVVAIENGAPISGVYVENSPNPTYPNYELVESGGAADLEPEEGSVSGAPYYVPVFWIALLSRAHPLLPAVFTAVAPPLLVTCATYPVWLGGEPAARRIRSDTDRSRVEKLLITLRRRLT